MLQAISNVLSDYFSNRYQIIEKIELKGGDTNQTKYITNGKTPVFIKYNQRGMLSTFIAEADQLRALARSKTVRVPDVYGVGQTRDYSFLLLEYFPHTRLDVHNSYLLGQQLARLHQWSEQANYGFDFDNDLETTPQPNNWQKRWATFFSQQRIGWQLQLAEEKGHYFGNIDKIVDISLKILKNHHPTPSLLHGDLWPSNCGLAEVGPVLFDPACYWGDRECDLAMLSFYPFLLPQIYDGYQKIWPLPDDFIVRQPLYQLYYLINKSHFDYELYKPQVEMTINKLLDIQI